VLGGGGSACEVKFQVCGGDRVGSGVDVVTIAN